MQLAQYFIHKKEVGSTLESEIESLTESNPEKTTVGYGQRIE